MRLSASLRHWPTGIRQIKHGKVFREPPVNLIGDQHMRLLPFALCALLLSACSSDLENSTNTTPQVPALSELTCPNGMPTVSALKADAERKIPGWKTERANDALAAALIEIYNNQPPASNSEADFVNIYTHPQIHFVVILLGLEPDCAVGSIKLPPEIMAVMRARTQS